MSHRPPAGILPVVGGVTAWYFLASVPLAGWLAVAGTGGVLGGLYRRNQRFVTLGAVGMGAGMTTAALSGAATAAVLGATVAIIVTWDTATVQVGLHEQLDAGAAVEPVVFAHGLATAAVTGTAALGVSLVSVLIPAGVPPATPVALVLLGLVLLTAALGRVG